MALSWFGFRRQSAVKPPQKPQQAVSSHRRCAFKFMVVGDVGAGKTALIHSFVSNEFDEKSAPTKGLDLKWKMLDIHHQEIKLSLWEIGRLDPYLEVACSPYRGAHAVIVVYDVTKRGTFDHDKLHDWLQEIDINAREDVIKMLLGSKIDAESERQVSRSRGSTYAQKYGMLFAEASAKTQVGVHAAIIRLVHEALEQPAFRDSMIQSPYFHPKQLPKPEEVINKKSKHLPSEFGGARAEKKDDENGIHETNMRVLNDDVMEQNAKLKQLLDKNKKENEAQNARKTAQIAALQMELKRMKREKEELMDEKKVMELCMKDMEEEIRTLKLRLFDEERYQQWTHQEVLYWILKLGNGRFKQYEGLLNVALKDENINGQCLHQIESSDLKEWGIKDFADRKCLLQHIHELTARENEGLIACDLNVNMYIENYQVFS